MLGIEAGRVRGIELSWLDILALCAIPRLKPWRSILLLLRIVVAHVVVK